MSAACERRIISMSEVVGKGYDDWWVTKAFDKVCKGSKGSKKSKTQALWTISHMMQYPLANSLVIRKVYNTLRQSCYTDLEWAIYKLGVEKFWSLTTSPMQMTYEPTGQKILFRGLDDPLKLASITVSKGYLCWVWVEEAFEIANEEDMRKIEFSIRGKIPPETGLWKQISYTFNPWSEHHWLKTKFYDQTSPNVFACTTTYKDNEFLGPDDIARYEELYITNPRAARVICDGDWGRTEGLIYPDTIWAQEDFDINKVRKEHPDTKTTFGLDFGFSISYNAFVALVVDLAARELWVFDEYYDNGKSNLEIAKKICQMGYGNEIIYADCAEPKSIYELQKGIIEKIDKNNGSTEYITWQLPNIRSTFKGKDSIRMGITALQGFKWHVHSRCRGTITELYNYAYDQDKDGNYIDRPIKEYDHCLTADTPILTDHGDVPIADIKEGDMVLTHRGYRKVLASGITQFNQPIYRLTLTDGRYIEGTWNHPIVTTEGIKYIKDVSNGNEVIVWGDQTKDAIQMQNMSNMMGYCGTGIQNQTSAAKESTSYITTPDYIDMSGRNTMGQYQKDVLSITSTETAKITTSPISNCLPLMNTNTNTRTLQNLKSGEKSIWPNIKTNAENGMLLQKDTNGTNNMSENTFGKKNNLLANNARKCLKLKMLETIDFAHPLAKQNGVVTPDSITRQEFVLSVVKNSQQTNTQKQKPALVHVATVTDTGKKANVYDLTVDDAHDFFANGILVHNCMDSVRYSLDFFLNSGKGMMVEIKGDKTNKKNDGTTASKWVYSTL